MDRAISRIDALNGRAGHRGLDASGGIIMPLTEITSDERGNAVAQPTVFVRLDISGGDDLFVISSSSSSILPAVVAALRPAKPPERIFALARAKCVARREWCSPRRKAGGECHAVSRCHRGDNSADRAALHRFLFVKAALPEAQHVLRQIEIVGHFTDGAKCVRRLVIQSKPLLSLILTRIRNRGRRASLAQRRRRC